MMKARLAQFSFGRILLHVTCAAQDHKLQWHWQGVLRELGNSAGSVQPAVAVVRPYAFARKRPVSRFLDIRLV